MSTIEVTGYVGGFLLAFSGLPQAIESVWKGRTGDINPGLLWMWVTGELLMFVYAAVLTPEIPLLLNFGFNFLLVSVITWYKYFPRKPSTPTRRFPLHRKTSPKRLSRLKSTPQ